MSNPTSNFNWQMPTNTDLVSQLPADFEVFGQAVDTSLADLKGGTTNQVLAKNSDTDMDFKWVADAAGMTNPMTTTGDTIYSSSGSTPARLGIGTAGQVLQVNSGATAPEWATPAAGGMTLISTTTLSGLTTTLSSIPQTYNSLFLIVSGMTANTSNRSFRMLPNDSNTIVSGTQIDGAALTEFNATRLRMSVGDTLRTNSANVWSLTINNYASTTAFKTIQMTGRYLNTSSVVVNNGWLGTIISTSAITSLVFDYENSDATFAGGTVLLYGVK